MKGYQDTEWYRLDTPSFIKLDVSYFSGFKYSIGNILTFGAGELILLSSFGNLSRYHCDYYTIAILAIVDGIVHSRWMIHWSLELVKLARTWWILWKAYMMQELLGYDIDFGHDGSKILELKCLVNLDSQRFSALWCGTYSGQKFSLYWFWWHCPQIWLGPWREQLAWLSMRCTELGFPSCWFWQYFISLLPRLFWLWNPCRFLFWLLACGILFFLVTFLHLMVVSW